MCCLGLVRCITNCVESVLGECFFSITHIVDLAQRVWLLQGLELDGTFLTTVQREQLSIDYGIFATLLGVWTEWPNPMMHESKKIKSQRLTNENKSCFGVS